MDSTERSAYQQYMAEGIRELHRLWDEPEELAEGVMVNPRGGSLVELAILSGGAFVLWKSGVLSSLTHAVTGAVASTASGAAAAAPSSSANTGAAANCSGVPGGGSGVAACQAGCNPDAWTAFAKGLGINNECAARWFLEHGCQGPTSLSQFTSWRDSNVAAHGGHYYYCELP